MHTCIRRYKYISIHMRHYPFVWDLTHSYETCLTTDTRTQMHTCMSRYKYISIHHAHTFKELQSACWWQRIEDSKSPEADLVILTLAPSPGVLYAWECVLVWVFEWVWVRTIHIYWRLLQAPTSCMYESMFLCVCLNGCEWKIFIYTGFCSKPCCPVYMGVCFCVFVWMGVSEKDIVCVWVGVWVWLWMLKCVHIYVCMCVCVRARVHAYACVGVWVCVRECGCVCVCVYVYGCVNEYNRKCTEVMNIHLVTSCGRNAKMQVGTCEIHYISATSTWICNCCNIDIYLQHAGSILKHQWVSTVFTCICDINMYLQRQNVHEHICMHTHMQMHAGITCINNL